MWWGGRWLYVNVTRSDGWTGRMGADGRELMDGLEFCCQCVLSRYLLGDTIVTLHAIALGALPLADGDAHLRLAQAHACSVAHDRDALAAIANRLRHLLAEDLERHRLCLLPPVCVTVALVACWLCEWRLYSAVCRERRRREVMEAEWRYGQSSFK